MSVQDALTEAQQHITQAFALMAAVVEAISTTESLEALTVEETANLLRKAKSTIYDMCRDGRLLMIDDRIPRWVIRDYLAGKRRGKKATKEGIR